MNSFGHVVLVLTCVQHCKYSNGKCMSIHTNYRQDTHVCCKLAVISVIFQTRVGKKGVWIIGICYLFLLSFLFKFFILTTIAMSLNWMLFVRTIIDQIYIHNYPSSLYIYTPEIDHWHIQPLCVYDDQIGTTWCVFSKVAYICTYSLYFSILRI